MILLSLLLVLTSLGLLIAGLAKASQPLVWASILSSLLAGVSLVFAVRRQRFSTAAEEDVAGAESAQPAARLPGGMTRGQAFAAGPATTAQTESSAAGQPAWPPGHDVAAEPLAGHGGAAGRAGADEDGADDDEYYLDPPDEPPEEEVAAVDAVRVVTLAATVVVVDGRPRYHLPDCPHLAAREAVTLPIVEARESGFTPCSRCRPDYRLAQQARAAATAAARRSGPEAPPSAAHDPGQGRRQP